MEILNATIRLGGDITFTVRKKRITPPEVLILRALHGPDAVVEIEKIGMDRREIAGEHARLLGLYGAAKDEKDNNIFGKVFPGAAMNLPGTLKEIGLEPSDYDETDELAEEESAEAKRAEEDAKRFADEEKAKSKK